MREWFETRPPRLQGVISCILGIGVALAGIGVARMLQDQFYPVVLPGAGLVWGMGIFQIAGGHSRSEVAKRKVPAAWTVALVVLMLAGIGAGLELNRVLYGVRW